MNPLGRILVFLFLAGAVVAHQPTTTVEGRMLEIGVAGWSWSIDGTLEDAEDVDWIRVPVEGRLDVTFLVPAGEGAGDVPLAGAIVAPGLETPAEGSLPESVTLAPGEGARVVRERAPLGETCHLGFCWVERGSLVFEGRGVAHVAVFSSGESGGPYTIAIGGAEGRPPIEPRQIPESTPGTPASAAGGEGPPAAFPGVVEFFGQNAHAPHAAWWLGLVIYGVPALVAALALFAVGALLGRRLRAA